MSRLLLIDADVLNYEAAFSAQHTYYLHDGERFQSANDCKAYCAEHEQDYRALRKEGKIKSELEVLPEATAEKLLHYKINNILDACGSDRYLLVLSGDNNFRDEVAVTKGYKANRANIPKPVHYQFVRNLLLNHPKLELATGLEADDAMGLWMAEDPEAVICSIDKDVLLGLPGRKYDWNTGKKYHVPNVKSLEFHMYQLLAGDTTDNIPGIPGMGDKKARDELIEGDPTGSWANVQYQYNEAPFTFKDGVVSGGPEDYLTEQMQLLWIMRYPDQRITPKEFERYLYAELS